MLNNLPMFVQPFSALHNYAGFFSVESAMELTNDYQPWLVADSQEIIFLSAKLYFTTHLSGL